MDLSRIADQKTHELISIIIPAYNEEHRLPGTLGAIHGYLTSRGFKAEVIVVDDGSCDGTLRVVKQASENYPEIRLVSNGSNRGKGFSVRHGMFEARGEIVLFTDADLSAPIEEADKLFAAIDDGKYHLAIGSRAMRSLIDVPQSTIRIVAGRLFNRLVKFFTGLEFSDTQCGFKAFQREATRILFEQQRINGFGFDPEILFLAHRHGLRIAEVPVRWAHVPGTKVRIFSDSLRMFTDLVKIRWRALVGIYGHPATRPNDRLDANFNFADEGKPTS
jgi:dolichyl-phosphate beta-glucosyltransferase